MSKPSLHGGPLDGWELKNPQGAAVIAWFGWQEWENGLVWQAVKDKQTKRKAIYHRLRDRWEYIRTEQFS